MHYNLIYILKLIKLKIFKIYIKSNLVNSFIRYFNYFISILILFIQKILKIFLLKNLKLILLLFNLNSNKYKTSKYFSNLQIFFIFFLKI